MRGRHGPLGAPLPPHGWSDLLRQIALFCGAYWLYRLVRGTVDGRAPIAFENARHLISIEKGLGLFVEPAVQTWVSGRAWLIDSASWLYVNSHFTITVATLAYIYLRRNESFYFLRNMFMVAMGIALAGYALFPTAPPRLMPHLGFTDSVAHLTGVHADASNVLVNPYAAVPSMHVAFALMLGATMARIVRRRWALVAWRAYPGVVTFVVVATANHWWLDAVLGALTAAAAAACAQAVFARARPEVWAPNTASPTARA
jgi:hypothetical protein